LEQDGTFPRAIDIEITDSGSIHTAEAKITFEVHTTTDLKILLKDGTVKDNRRDSLRKETPMNAMTIKGKGKALIKMNVEYTDNNGNVYRNALAMITLDVRSVALEEIAFNGLSPEDEMPLLAA
jgi:hypothetical protein